MKQTECSETSAYKIQPPENYPEESIQYLNHITSVQSSDWPCGKHGALVLSSLHQPSPLWNKDSSMGIVIIAFIYF